MFDLFSSGSTSKKQARRLAKAIERGTNIINRNSRKVRGVFRDAGYEFEKDRFLDIAASMFAMLIIDNVRKREAYDTEAALSAFLSAAKKDHLLHADPDHTFDAPLSDREALKREAATWAARKYFGGKPVEGQIRLFYERAEKFVGYIENTDTQRFDQN